MANIADIGQLRAETGVSIMECKKAIEEAGGDISKAKEILQKFGEKAAEKKACREIKEGLIASYVHANGKMGALLELGCETDFVAKNDSFKQLANDLAMQVAAMGAESKEDLMAQSFIKDPEKTVESIIKEKIAKIGENIQIGQFVRFSIH